MGAKVSHNLDESLSQKPDAVMMLRVQKERMQGSFFPSEREYAKSWALTGERFSSLGENSVVLHPGPMNRGFEISSEAADSSKSLVLKQVANGVSVRMAVLYATLSGEAN